MIRGAALAAAGLVLGACATGGPPPTATPPAVFLDDAALDGLAARFSPTPAPLVWSAGELANFGPGSDRWWLATAQAELRPPHAAQHFDCVLGTRLAQKPRPALTRLMTRLLADSNRATRLLAERHPRPRPIAVDPDLQPCQRIDAATRDSPSWPAGGAVAGAAYGELFARLAPDQATASRERGSDLGFSRVVCRMNWLGDFRDGVQIGRAIYAQAASAPDFAAELEAARTEVAAARAEGLANPGCAAERRALRRTGY